jgi:hypothetical protein
MLPSSSFADADRDVIIPATTVSEYMLRIKVERGEHAVAYLVEALCYKPEGRGFDSR